jgi:DNA-binding CsgD family transcriptional regulator/tetratricopeptide (TPR) repeat protein
VPGDPTASSLQRASDGSHAPWLFQAHASFVGRQSELHQLKAAFEQAASGQGALIMLVGEPGIGKTALCREFAARCVDTRGGVSLVGHCYPMGSATLPYQPFVEAFESYARERDAKSLRAELGSSASEVARIVPSLRTMLGIQLAAPENPGDDHLRLLSGILDGLRHIGALHAVLLVLEDLHDADRGTLDLLLYLARHLAGTPLLVLGTYRDLEVDRAHPLAAALAELRRVSHFERLRLGELSVDEVQRLMSSTSHQAVPPPLADVVHRRSGGNALFAHELLRFLLSERLVEERDGVLRRVGDESLAGQMPEGLRDVVGKRLSRLSADANRVLSVASVIGREFHLDVLRRVHQRPDEELESALEEAVSAALVEENQLVGATITYRFSHAFFQQTLYDEIMAPRRIRLHHQIARALEEVHARRLEEHAAELAEHYSFSSDTSDLSKAVNYATLAAKRATAVFAYGEAARQLERALAVQDLVDPDDRVKRYDLSLALGKALFASGETERVIERIAPDALALAEALGDRGRAFDACHLALDCFFVRGGTIIAAQPEYLRWAERAAQDAEPESIERSHADLALAEARFSRGEFAQARALRSEALALARRHGDAEAFLSSAFYLLSACAPQYWDEHVRLAEECAGWPRQGVSRNTLGQALYICGLVQLAQGDRTRAEELWRQVERLAERTRVANIALFMADRAAILAILDGRLDDAVGLVARYIERADESGAPVRGRRVGLLTLIGPALYLGRADIWLSAFDEHAWVASLAGPGQPVAFNWRLNATRAICLAQLGHLEEASALVGPLLDDVATSTDGELAVAPVAMLLQAAVVLEHHAAARALAARLACVAHLTADTNFYTCVARHLGDAAALVGDRAAARAYYLQAVDAASKIRFRPEVALAHLGLAELMLEDDEESEALEHLNVAIPELRDMKMQPGLDRGLSLLEQIGSQAPAPATAALVSHVLTGREQTVARLLAAGRSNREIADTLVITEGTVEVHVKHILSKLSLRSRAQVATWFADQHSEGGAERR